jgi:biotin carboxyl carrier protein
MEALLFMNERQSLIARLVLTHLALPLGLAAVAFLLNSDAFLFNVIAQTTLLIVFFAGYWEFFPRRFRYYFSIGLEAVLIVQLAYRVLYGTHGESNPWLIIVLALVEIYLLVQVIRIIAVILKKDPQAYEIEFPLKNGEFLITDGGNARISRLMNYHYYSSIHKKKHTNLSMLYATDIVKRAGSYPSFFPKENSSYPIFGDDVYSPIEGTIVKVENTIADNQAFSGNYPYNTGNTVVIRHDNYVFLLGHLKQGSITVKPGDNVAANQVIAKAGNSGMSERPHIHVQLMRSKSDDYWHGEGICIQFNGTNLYKNRVIRN